MRRHLPYLWVPVVLLGVLLAGNHRPTAHSSQRARALRTASQPHTAAPTALAKQADLPPWQAFTPPKDSFNTTLLTRSWVWNLAPPDSDSTANPAQRRYWRDSRYDYSRRGFERRSPLYLDRPPNVQVVYELAPDGKGYLVREQVNGRDVRPPSYITREEFLRILEREQRERFFKEFADEASVDEEGNRLIPQININSGLFQSIFGSGVIDIQPNLTVLMDLGVRTNRIANPALNLRQQRNTFFDFNQQIQMNLVGRIGERFRVQANYDTEASFDFENQFKVEYTGLEDDIIKTVEAGNVSLPLNGTLITGGQNLWGLKLGMQFGPLTITTVASQQRGRTNEIVVRGGATQTPYEIEVAEYDENRHFFLNHFFRSQYERSLQNIPILSSPINVTRMEVYITNTASASVSNNRTAVGFPDLGENDPASGGRFVDSNFVDIQLNPNPAIARNPQNAANNLYSQLLQRGEALRSIANRPRDQLNAIGLEDVVDYELVSNMRRLSETEYSFNAQLGYLSLNTRLQQNQVLFIAYEYTLAGQQGVFKVGEFSNDVPDDGTGSRILFLKMLKPASQKPITSPTDPNLDPYPTWDLMMKNIYSLGTFNISPENFRVEVTYQSTDGQGDVNYVPTTSIGNTPLIQLVGLDQLTNNITRGPDNRFDYLPGVTINPEQGLIIFPYLEPFGSRLVALGESNPASDGEIIDTAFAYGELYTQTQVDAIQFSPRKNRFKISGEYNSAGIGAEIPLNAVQIVEGSVRVTANGQLLTEGVDYRVDYLTGRVILNNPALLSGGSEIRITFESNTLFGIDQKTLIGTRLDYQLSKQVQLGATLLYLNERPLINKIRIGEEPMSNLLWGFDATINTDAPGITNFLNKWPWYESEAKSTISFTGEFAQLNPGTPTSISTSEERGIAYLDDFEGAQNFLSLGAQPNNWTLASFPENTPNLTSPQTVGDTLSPLYTRAKLAWYSIDARFYDQPGVFGLNQLSPSLNDAFTRRVSSFELFPNRTVAGTDFLPTFDLHYLPAARGPYNFNPALNADGSLPNPQQNWAGIMRRTSGSNDFEASNFEYLEFWVLDPFLDNPGGPGGKLYINLGEVSEDVLPDERQAAEHGLPTNAADDAANAGLNNTEWGRVPIQLPPTVAFDNDAEARPFQDVGLDGLSSAAENTFFQAFITAVQGSLNPSALAALLADPTGDDFQFFLDDGFADGTPILERYLNYNGTEGNSPVTNAGSDFATAATLQPDIEDLNQNQTANTREAYWEYEVDVDPLNLQPGQGYVVDQRETLVDLPNGSQDLATWYLVRIPLRSGTARGGIQNFKAIDFVRMYMTGWQEEVVMRFGTFRLVASQWRTLQQDLTTGSPLPPSATQNILEVAALSIEENGDKSPFPYTIPPDIIRQGVPGSPIPNQLQNEQALQLRLTNLQDGEARAVFRVFNVDLRFYERLKMWVHAEPLGASSGFDQPGEATIFMRLGSDYTDNYYEYEIPLTPSTPGDLSPRNIWLEGNEFDFSMEELTAVKVQRNNAGASSVQPFTTTLGNGRRITVVGNPQLSNIENVLIGVRNDSTQATNDGLPIDVEVWVNELRATNFDQSPGWAATSRLNIRLADLGSISLSASHSTPGFGGIQSKVWQRSIETATRYDITGNLELGKLLPESWGLEIPFYFTYGEQFVRPKFNPIDPDVLLNTRLENTAPVDRDEVLRRTTTYGRQYSFAFNNVRLLSTNPEKKPHFWDVQNFSVTFAYSDEIYRDPQIQQRRTTLHQAGITYAYNFSPKNYQPFKSDSSGVNPISAFNFYLLPQQVSFTVDGFRRYEEEQLRQQNPNNLELQATYVQDFRLSRTFGLQWDLSRSLSLNFNAQADGRVDEPRGPLDTQAKRDTLWYNFFSLGRDTARNRQNFINFGRTLTYSQSLNATYRIPLNTIKPLDWMNLNLGYIAEYQWQAAPLDFQGLGNLISNNQTWQPTANLRFESLYSKWPWLDTLLQPVARRNIFSEADSLRQEGDDARVAGQRFYKTVLGFIFSLKSVDLNYTLSRGTTIPGFLPNSELFGNDLYYINPNTGQQGAVAPGWGFVFGEQPTLSPSEWFAQARANGWITQDGRQTQQFMQNSRESISGRATFEPLQGLTINLNFTRQEQDGYSGLFNFDTLSGDYVLSNELRSGTFTISTFAVGTSFISGNSDRLFEEFTGEARRTISARLQAGDANYASLPGAGLLSDGFYNGYTGSQQDVLIPAFLATYGPGKVGDIDLTAFPAIPLPNWEMSFTGLSEAGFMQNTFKTVTLNHAYRATYTTSYLGNILEDTDADGQPDTYTRLDSIGGPLNDPAGIYNFEPGRVIQTATITESWSPLIGVNLVWQSGLGLLIDYKKNRTLSLNIGALQLTETRNDELTLNLSYTRDKTGTPLALFGRLIEIRNSLAARFEVTVRDTRTQNRNLNSELPPQPTQGNFSYTLKPSLDYNINTQLTARVYYEYNRNQPVLSTSFPTSYSAFGIQLRLTVTQ